MLFQLKQDATPDSLVKTVNENAPILITVRIVKVNVIVMKRDVTFLPDGKGIASDFKLV